MKLNPATKFCERIDFFIGRLVEGQETKISECEKDLYARTALKLEFESPHSSLVPLYRFNKDAIHWPEFFECFYTHVNCKSSFDDNIKMTYLLSILDAVEAVGTYGLFYTRALKTLKREFANTLPVAHLRLKSIFNKPQIKPNDRPDLREFHQQIKLNNTWLSSLRYKAPFYLYYRVTKVILRLTFHLRKNFTSTLKIQV